MVWLAPAALGASGNSGIFALGGPIFLLGVFAPAIVALALTASREGRAGVERLLAPIGRWHVGARIILGVIWALWNLPLFFLPGSGSDGQSSTPCRSPVLRWPG